VLAVSCAFAGARADDTRPLCTPSFFHAPASLTIPRGPGCRTVRIAAPKADLILATATTEAERERGLMDVRSLPAFTGLIFVWPSDADRTFWMKDTLIPLDMIFVDGTGKIVLVAPDVPASTPTTPDDQVARRGARGTFVIELAAGAAEKAGLRSGVKLEIPAIPSSE